MVAGGVGSPPGFTIRFPSPGEDLEEGVVLRPASEEVRRVVRAHDEGSSKSVRMAPDDLDRVAAQLADKAETGEFVTASEFHALLLRYERIAWSRVRMALCAWVGVAVLITIVLGWSRAISYRRREWFGKLDASPPGPETKKSSAGRGKHSCRGLCGRHKEEK